MSLLDDLITRYRKGIEKKSQLGGLSHDHSGDGDGFSVTRGEQQYVDFPWECVKEFLLNNKLYPPVTPFLEEKLTPSIDLTAPDIVTGNYAWKTLHTITAEDELFIIDALGIDNMTGDYENQAFRLSINDQLIPKIGIITHEPYGQRHPQSEMFRTTIILEPGKIFKIEAASVSGLQTAENFATVVQGRIFNKDLC